uniref:G_PROTEIN_RECEP_F1_2 domain-containing protein n=1 Tax=Parastrongyloides trichosuri TaxID=131310 RepID=A0A0N4ZI57_PARTI
MMSFEPFMGQILLFTEGVTVYFNNISWIAVWTCYHVFTFCLSFCNVTLTFIYRYFILIHNYVLGRTQFILLTVFVIFWNLMFVLFLGLSLVNEKSPNYNIILQRAKEVYKEEIEHGSSQLVILDIFGTFGVLFNAFLTLTIVLASIIIIYCFAKIRITLNSQQNIMSKRSKELQRQLNKAMLIHASVPMIICFLPISILELMGYFNINIKAFCTLFFFAFEWVPFFNGIISLTLIGSCRNYTKKIFGLEVKVEKITQATVID